MHDRDESPLFEPMVILPAQITVDVRWTSGIAGPIALMLAVVEDAARCIEHGRRDRHRGIQKVAAEAEAWVRSERRDSPFSFANICDVLGVDVDAARARLLDSRESTMGRRRTPVWGLTRGHGRTMVRPARRAPRAA